ncbi:ABC transporter substrate-binding protein [Flavobacteriaceae bacterium]|nr:ABC transporter substrate-binding protein [Flavobacteriaceae bacterium]RZO99908.1 MAG: ABC transporter substrate-binding protein [Flavobacteriales bacterium]
MKFIAILFFSILSIPLCISQNWNGHYSYHNSIDTSIGNGKIFTASENAIYIHSTQDDQLSIITTIDGLSGDFISNIYYSTNFNKLIIGYENGLIQIVDFNNDNILTIYDIIEKTTIPPNKKKINEFTEVDNIIYISTDYGVSLYDLNSLEFSDSLFIGEGGTQQQVNQTIINDNFLYAVLPDFGGIKRVNLDLDIINYQNWELVYSGDFDFILNIDDSFVFTNENNVFFNENGTFSQVISLSQTIKKIVINEGKIIITSEDKIFIYDTNFNLINSSIISSNFNTNFNSSELYNNYIYVATSSKGLLKININNVQQNYSILPAGPLDNNVFSISSLYGSLWATFGDYTSTYNPYPLARKGVSHWSDEYWNNINYDSIPENAVNLNNISINPFDLNNIFISSYHGGLLEISDESLSLFDQSNSGLESLISNETNYNSVRISGSNFDDSGTLWLMNSRVDNPLKSFNLDTNQWSSYDFTQIIPDGFNDELGFSDIVIGSNGTKWIGGLNSGLIGFNENAGNPLIKRINDNDVGNLPSPYVKSLAMDNNNHLWIGTIKGLRVLYNTSNFFDANVSTQQIVIEEDGIYKELLEQQFISDIKVDGSNNKWVGTIGSGLFYFSQNGQQTIYHFTKNNSPLPSNNINDIALDFVNGLVFIATDKGLVSFDSGGSTTSSTLNESYVYPNPVRPSFNMNIEKIKISGITEDINIKITDISGNLVAEANSNVNNRYNGFNLEIDGGIAYWNGKNLANNSVSSGVYIVMLSDLDSYDTKILKIMIIR